MTYVHVELDRHALLLAEGLAAESYLDTGNRGLFAGVGGVREMEPDMLGTLSARAWDERACAPLTLGGPAVMAAHRALCERAAAIGHGLGEDADLRVIADGVALAPLREDAAGMTVRVPAGVRRVVLRSRVMAPNQIDPARDDRRGLGVAVAGLRWGGAELSLGDAVCAGGFHALEWAGSLEMRWTAGAGEVALPVSATSALLEITLLPGLLSYPVVTRAGVVSRSRVG